jgi:striatin 1/3/4
MGGMMNGGATTDGQSNSASGGAPEMNLASVLHFLQSEWRRWERDRNEWEIERAEMRVGRSVAVTPTLTNQHLRTPIFQ